jgi:hypothetical protein
LRSGVAVVAFAEPAPFQGRDIPYANVPTLDRP